MSVHRHYGARCRQDNGFHHETMVGEDSGANNTAHVQTRPLTDLFPDQPIPRRLQAIEPQRVTHVSRRANRMTLDIMLFYVNKNSHQLLFVPAYFFKILADSLVFLVGSLNKLKRIAQVYPSFRNLW